MYTTYHAEPRTIVEGKIYFMNIVSVTIKCQFISVASLDIHIWQFRMTTEHMVFLYYADPICHIQQGWLYSEEISHIRYKNCHISIHINTMTNKVWKVRLHPRYFSEWIVGMACHYNSSPTACIPSLGYKCLPGRCTAHIAGCIMKTPYVFVLWGPCTNF